MVHKQVQQAIVLIGLPGSGKTTYARRLVKSMPNAVIISTDDMRTMLSGEYTFDRALEPLLEGITLSAVALSLQQGFSAIIDEALLTLKKQDRTNLNIWLKNTCSDIDIKYVVFPENEAALERRIKEARGLDPEHWRKAYAEMKVEFEPIGVLEGNDTVVFK